MMNCRGGLGGFAGFADHVDDGLAEFGSLRLISASVSPTSCGSTLSRTKMRGPHAFVRGMRFQVMD